ncbi:TonB-dependent receptor [Salibacter sp.]|uniref:TonB-dependent receptor n=1 Tax=Salibacter sp. TaxID=2010995 RepID=UPI0028708076|nr:TonB-dependent receptor [Salibacter sp.]MDR9487612.1 TonB-dependent receptor [Salibacter sp.]
MKRQGLLFVCLWLMVVTAMAQNVTLKGKVLSTLNEPLPGATVLIEGTYRGTSTDEKGAFSFEGLSEKEYQLKISYIGYATKKVTVDLAANGQSPLEVMLKRKAMEAREVTIEATRATEETPIAFENISEAEIENRNFGQDIPYVLDMSTSVTTTSDAGAGVGYTGMRIRGSDNTRVNVTINGIPYNDAESHGTFWVNMPDLASSADNIQIQRGVGTSTNGAGAFGGTMKINTLELEPEAFGKYTGSYGSFNTMRHTVEFGSGLTKNNFAFDGRLSTIQSDGYIDRASSDLKSYYFSGGYYGEKTTLKFLTFGGKERTYQAWNGVPPQLLDENRTFNSYTYPDEVDNYEQTHYQLHWLQDISKSLSFTASLHYTKGQGYFEQYKGAGYNYYLNFDSKESFGDYGLEPINLGTDTFGLGNDEPFLNPDASARYDTTVVNGDSMVVRDSEINETNLIQRRWLDNDFYGIVYSLQYSKGNFDFTLGGGANEYVGDHYGEIIWAEYSSGSEIYDRFYDNTATKTDINVYGKANYRLNDFNFFGDLQLRQVEYEANGVDNDGRLIDVDETLTFFNPKVGFTWNMSEKSKLYGSVSVAHREPTRNDYLDAPDGVKPKPEELIDYEFGYKRATQLYSIGANFYFMDYNDQLVLTGDVNDVGSAVRMNVPESYRAGIELTFGWQITKRLDWQGNATFSQNKISSYTEKVDDWVNGGQIEIERENTDIAFSPNTIAATQLAYTVPTNFTGLDDQLKITGFGKYVGEQHFDNTGSDQRVLDAYLTNDIQLSYGIKNSFVRHLEVAFQVRNVLDVDYITNAWVYRFASSNPGYVDSSDPYVTKEKTNDANNPYYRYTGLFPQAGRNYMATLRIKF